MKSRDLIFPHLRSYWGVCTCVTGDRSKIVSAATSQIFLEAKASAANGKAFFISVSEFFSRVMKYLQAQDSLNTQMVTDELLPLLHPDLDMEKKWRE